MREVAERIRETTEKAKAKGMGEEAEIKGPKMDGLREDKKKGEMKGRKMVAGVLIG